MKKIFFSSLTLFISFLFIAVHTVSAQGPTRTPTPGGGTFTLTVQAVIPNSTGGTVPAVKGKTILVRTTFNAQRQWPAISNPMQMQISLKNSSNVVVSTITSNNLFQGGNDTQFTIPATTPSGTGYYIEVRGLQTVENGPTRVNPTAKSAPFSVVDPSLTPSPSRSPTPSPSRTPTTTQGTGTLPDLQVDWIRTDQQSSIITVRMCNRGTAAIPEGRNFSVSVTNPTTGANNISNNYSQAVPVNGCLEQTIPCNMITCSATNVNIVIDRLNQVAESNEADNTRTGVNLQNTVTTSPPNCLLQPRGDADCNGAFQSEDYTIWAKFFLGQDYPTKQPHHKGDFNSDGKVSVTDAEIWRMSFYSPVPTIITGTVTLPPVSPTSPRTPTPSPSRTPTATPSRTPTPSKAPTPTAIPTYVSSFSIPTNSQASLVGIDTDTTGNLYIADQFGSKIHKYSPSGQLITSWGTFGSGNGQFNRPFNVAINEQNGNVYVLDYATSSRLQIFTSGGAFVQKVTLPVVMDSPRGMDVDPSNGDIYIADSNKKTIYRYRAATGWTSFGSDKLIHPGNISASAGNLYVMDGINGTSRIVHFLNGAFVKQWGSPGTGNNQFWEGGYISVDRNGYVYVGDYSNDRVIKFAATGVQSVTFGTRGTQGGQFSGAGKIAFNPTTKANGWQDIYVIDMNNSRIQLFRQ